MAVRFPEEPQVIDPEEIERKELAAVPRYQEMQHLVAAVKPGRELGRLYCPRGVAFESSTKQIYVAGGVGSFAHVSIFSETCEFLKSFSHEYMSGVWGIAIHRDNIYVTDGREHFIFHFKLSADISFVTRIGGLGSGIAQFNGPRQLTVSTNGEIFVSDCNNHRIQILDCDLHYQRHISHHSIRQPCDVKLTPATDSVYVLTSDSPCVHVFSYAGTKLRCLITRGDIGMQVVMPLFLCLDSEENIIISDWGAHQIKIFSKEGTLLHTLGERGHEGGMFDFPFGITLTTNHKLVIVSYNDNYALQIFSCF